MFFFTDMLAQQDVLNLLLLGFANMELHVKFSEVRNQYPFNMIW